MSNYTLANIPVRSAYQIIPLQAPDSFLAIAGAWDMPGRTGKCFHDWGNEGIEPYVREDEIRLGGRDIDFYGVVSGTSKNDALRKCYGLFRDLDSYTSPVPLTSDLFGTWNVYVRDEIQVEWLQAGYCTIRIPFREPLPDLAGVMPSNKPIFQPVDVTGLLLDYLGQAIQVGAFNYDGYGISGVTFNNLG